MKEGNNMNKFYETAIEIMSRIKCAPIVFNGTITDYDVTDIGIVIGKRIKRTLNGRVIPVERKSIVPVIDKDGYETISLHVDGKHYHVKVHRLVAQAFIPNPENKPEVNHKDGNKKNNTVENLEWVTAKENTAHAAKTGLRHSITGESHNWAKYTNEDIHKVCKLLEDKNNTLERISILTGVNKVVICNIGLGKIWKNISKNYNFPKRGYSSRTIYSDEILSQVAELKNSGESYKSISMKLNLENPDLARYLFRKYNMKNIGKSSTTIENAEKQK